ncbi:MAG: phosphate ABC transporter permease subunit PstC [Candidatus Marinimicrobia bacterium]|nr:phosphate ABC transporter permease subunit PstC [Candidatus Neomarinimicrobiota bacterium]
MQTLHIGNTARGDNLILSARARWRRKLAGALGQGTLFAVTSVAALAVLFIFYFIARDALPFFRSRGLVEFLTQSDWYPSKVPGHFGAKAIFVGSALVTLGSVLVAVPLGVAAAVCLSDVLPFSARQIVKPVIEILAAIPSVAYGFFALVVFAPLLQDQGNRVLAIAWWILAAPTLFLLVMVLGDLATNGIKSPRLRPPARLAATVLFGAGAAVLLLAGARGIHGLTIVTGTNALNVSIILGIMALPTVVSVSEDALQAAGRDLREGSYALGATRAETICKTILPAASSGILAAAMLGTMRALGETMVVWMASGNAAQIPSPIYNYLMPVRTLTATIAGDMGEADHVTGSDRYHVLFAMGLCLLAFSFVCNLIAEWVVARQRRKLRGE